MVCLRICRFYGACKLGISPTLLSHQSQQTDFLSPSANVRARVKVGQNPRAMADGHRRA
jgi:hypothetical protein